MKFIKELVINIVIFGILFCVYTICFNDQAIETFSQNDKTEITVYLCQKESQKALSKEIDVSGGRVIFLTKEEFSDTLKNKLRIIAKNGYNIKSL